jgi:hypothetical protein
MSGYALAAWIVGTGLAMALVCYLIDRVHRWLNNRLEANPRG